VEAKVYSRVVVATDGSDRSLAAQPVGEAASAAFGCPLELLHVPADEDPPGLDTTGLTVRSAQDPAAGLVAHATETEPPGLLCLATHGRGPVGELVFGSVTAQVIRTLHAPLLVVGPSLREAPRPWRRMLICLDGSATAATIVPVVAAWANHLELEVELLHVAYPLGDPQSGDFQVPDEDRVAAEQLRTAATELQAAGVAARWTIIEHTDRAEGIAQHADHGRSDLIALATHGRTGLARIIAGSVALAVLRHATVPVVTLRPEQLR